jgi:hypothetical protein
MSNDKMWDEISKFSPQQMEEFKRKCQEYAEVDVHAKAIQKYVRDKFEKTKVLIEEAKILAEEDKEKNKEEIDNLGRQCVELLQDIEFLSEHDAQMKILYKNFALIPEMLGELGQDDE